MSAVGAVLAGTVTVIRKAAVLIVTSCFVYMSLAVLAQVLGRYLFNYSISWTEETARFAQTWVVLVGTGVAARHGMHVAIDALPALLPLWPARLVSLFIAAGGVWFLGLVVYGSLPLIELGWMFERSPALHLPMWIIYLCLPIGAGYCALELVLTVIGKWNAPFGAAAERPEPEQSA